MDDSEFSFVDGCEDDSQDGQVQYPQQRNAANARERARMRVLSRAFCRLKTTLPWVPPDTKLSKLDTLRLATSYIAHLRAILKLTDNEAPDPTTQPVNTSWPFNFHHNWDISQRQVRSDNKNDWNYNSNSREERAIKNNSSNTVYSSLSVETKISDRKNNNCNFYNYETQNQETTYNEFYKSHTSYN